MLYYMYQQSNYLILPRVQIFFTNLSREIFFNGTCKLGPHRKQSNYNLIC